MRLIYYLIFAAVILVSCQRQQSLEYNVDDSVSVGLNTLTTLSAETGNIIVRDFILDPSKVDSVTSNDPALDLQLSARNANLHYSINKGLKQMAVVNFWIGGLPYSVPVRKSDKIDYTFTYDPHGEVFSKIQIAGQMNNWSPDMTPELLLNSDGLYEVTMSLSPGTYLYQMKIEGDQNHDANNPAKVDNGYGKFNSILQVNGDEDKFPRLKTQSVNANSLTLQASGQVDKVWAFWNNIVLNCKFVNKSKCGNIEIYIPEEAKKYSSSSIRVWAVNEYGISNDVLVPLSNGKVVNDANQLTRHDKYKQIIYFMLVDRFKNGSKENDFPINDPDVDPRVNYYGGDLAGLQQVIEEGYFDRLGANTLWVSPLNQNPLTAYAYLDLVPTKFTGYHGYWPISSSKVDFRFGSNDELKELVSVAHDNEMNVLLDYVANHVHEEHPFYQNHPEFATQLHLPDGRLNVSLWDENRLTTWFDTFMPSLDMGNPIVVDIMVDSALYWVEEFNIDGFRHDACKHVNEEYWRELTYRIKKNNPNGNFYQVGESYGSPELMASYVNSGMLCGQFDFNVFDEATSAFNGVSGGTMQRLSNVLLSSIKIYGTHNLMGYISGNHDKARFMALASGDLALGEDSKVAGWTRNIGITDSVAYDRFALMHVFNATIPGVPVYYYGDEIGMTGGNDPDSRRMMYFEGWNNREEALFDKVAALNNLRTSNMALIYGDFEMLEVREQTMAYARKYFGDNVFVFINNSDEEQVFEIDITDYSVNPKTIKSLFGENAVVTDSQMTITLPALSAEVIY